MPELVHQTWTRITGRPWSDARAGGFTDGTATANLALQQRLLGGWNPYDTAAPAAAPAAPVPATPLTPAPSLTSGPGPVPVDPGLAAQQWEAMLALQLKMAEDARAQWEAQQADVRRATEAQLAANPADFVAYELYKRALVEEGYTPTGSARSNLDIRNIFELALGLGEGTPPREPKPQLGISSAPPEGVI